MLMSKDERGLREREEQTPQPSRFPTLIQEIVIKVPTLCFFHEDNRPVAHKENTLWAESRQFVTKWGSNDWSLPFSSSLPSLQSCASLPASVSSTFHLFPIPSHPAAWIPSSYQDSAEAIPSQCSIADRHPSPSAERHPPNPVSLCMDSYPSHLPWHWLYVSPPTTWKGVGDRTTTSLSSLFPWPSARNTRRHWNVCCRNKLIVIICALFFSLRV